MLFRVLKAPESTGLLGKTKTMYSLPEQNKKTKQELREEETI